MSASCLLQVQPPKSHQHAAASESQALLRRIPSSINSEWPTEAVGFRIVGSGCITGCGLCDTNRSIGMARRRDETLRRWGIEASRLSDKRIMRLLRSFI